MFFGPLHVTRVLPCTSVRMLLHGRIVIFASCNRNHGLVWHFRAPLVVVYRLLWSGFAFASGEGVVAPWNVLRQLAVTVMYRSGGCNYRVHGFLLADQPARGRIINGRDCDTADIGLQWVISFDSLGNISKIRALFSHAWDFSFREEVHLHPVRIWCERLNGYCHT